ncbi:MAG TPA: S8 family serine peptidase, partial [Caldilineaceae bacterium]|nr:S8 family serine peptidase [Caldilineaceae bacterium]
GLDEPLPEPLVTVEGESAFLLTIEEPGLETRELLNEIRRLAAEVRSAVFVDPNYIAGLTSSHSPGGACANPMSGEASPMSGEASPMSGEASPISATVGSLNQAQAIHFFWKQWAFSPTVSARGVELGGIDLDAKFSPSSWGGANPSGAGATVIVLDTSPFPAPGVYTFGPPDWFTQTMTVTVSHPVASHYTQTNPSVPPGTPPCSLAEHGLFAAGLVYAVAPGATIELWRLLNDEGLADLGAILKVLDTLVQSSTPKRVINMSFVLVPLPSGQGQGAMTRTAACNLLRIPKGQCTPVTVLQALRSSTVNQNQFEQILAAFDAAMLEALIGNLAANDVAMAAAAGNYSDASGPQPAMLPASLAITYPHALLSVMGGMHNRQRAIYSNRGVVMAPGGGEEGPTCGAVVGSGCWDSPENYLASIAVFEDNRGPFYSFGLWAGTSFATPIVSAMLAVGYTGTVPSVVNTVKGSTCSASGSPSLPGGLPPGLCFKP